MARLHVKITDYVGHDDPDIDAAARATYAATMHLHRLVAAHLETSGEVATAGTDEESQPDLGEVGATSPEHDPLDGTSQADIRAWAKSVGIPVNPRGSVRREVRDAYALANPSEDA